MPSQQQRTDSRKESFFEKIKTAQPKIRRGFYQATLKFWDMVLIAGLVFALGIAVGNIYNLVQIAGMRIWPSAYDPVARFVANMDWETNTVHLDATMSKAFEDKIDKFIWRIDDGTSLVAGDKLDHTFENPGYYYIQLSIVDQNQQSDVATCQIMVPPEEVERVSMSERSEVRSGESLVEDTSYIWAPVGTFYNYSKLPYNSQSYSDLKSRYVDSNCGLSSRGYNIQDVSSNVSYQARRIRKATANLVMTGVGAIIAVGVYLLVKRGLKKEMEKVES